MDSANSTPEDQPAIESEVSTVSYFIFVALLYLLHYSVKCWYIYRENKAFRDKHGCQPMETWVPCQWSLVLDMFKRQRGTQPDQQIMQCQSQYFNSISPNMTFKLLGRQGYLTADPKNIESILSTNFEDWAPMSQQSGLMPMLGKGIFTQNGKEWRHSRELLRRQFVRIHSQGLRAFDEHVEKMVSKLRRKGGIVDLQPYFFRFTLSTTMELIFGKPVLDLSREETDTFENAFDYASYITSIRLRLADLEWIFKPFKFQRSCKLVKNYAAHYVQLALDDLKTNGEEAAYERHSFILDLHKDLQDPGLVRDQLVHILIAGRDTTACLISWVFFQLVRHPESLRKTRDEIRSVTGGSTRLSRAAIKKMSYLRCVINETQRLYPQQPVSARISTKTTLFPSGGGPDGKSPVFIPKDTGIGYSIYHMHRLKSLYGKDADSFRPERWVGPELDNIGWAFMPFHGGPRLCLGKEFALEEASYAIVRIIQTFPRLRLPPRTPVVPPGMEKHELITAISSADGCKVLLN